MFGLNVFYSFSSGVTRQCPMLQRRGRSPQKTPHSSRKRTRERRSDGQGRWAERAPGPTHQWEDACPQWCSRQAIPKTQGAGMPRRIRQLPTRGRLSQILRQVRSSPSGWSPLKILCNLACLWTPPLTLHLRGATIPPGAACPKYREPVGL